jgi:hypothetical protein
VPLDAVRAKRAGDRYAFFKPAGMLGAKVLRIAGESGGAGGPGRAVRPVRLTLVAGEDGQRFALRTAADR